MAGFFIPNTTTSILRSNPAAVDAYGDPADDNTVFATNLPALITERAQRTFDPASGRLTVVEQYVIRYKPGAPAVVESDRIRDDRTQTIYQADRVSTPPTVVAAQGQRIDASRVS